MDNSLNSSSTVVYPYCYKIKETCIPCDTMTSEQNNNNIINIKTTNCIDELSRISKNTSENKNVDDLFNCLKKYGDIYKKLGIELYVNPKTKAVQFPDNQRIQSNLNVYLEEIDPDTTSPKINTEQEEKFKLYNILLNDKMRKMYNDFYYSKGFSELDSISPKEYGIAKIMGPDTSTGGKKHKRRTNKRKTNKRRTNKRRTNKRKTNKRRKG